MESLNSFWLDFGNLWDLGIGAGSRGGNGNDFKVAGGRRTEVASPSDISKALDRGWRD